ncbi:MAG: hypothetical protein Q4D38_00235 [Planctomycetia bacterium]|nr:hypothetical protein [Planctomycetia bacterium]
MSKYCMVKAKAPFRSGLRRLTAADLNLPVKEIEVEEKKDEKLEEVKVVEPEIQETVVETESETQETTKEVSANETQEEVIYLKDCKEFTSNNVKLLAVNNIETTEQLQTYMETNGDLEALDKIGAVRAESIVKEYNTWKTNQNDQN